MTALLRVAGAIVFGSIVTSGVWASTPTDTTFNMPDASQACSLPSVTASSPISQDFAILLASADEPVANEPVADQVAAKEATSNEAADQNSCCNSCDTCSDCICCYQPLWYVSAGTVILHRDSTGGTIVGNNPFTGTAFSRGTDFNYDWEGGPDITIGRRFGCDNVLEARYFNSYESADLSFRTPGGFIGAGFTGPANTLFDGHALTKLDSTEINWRRQQWDQLAWLVGFRWVELQDEADYHINNTVAEGDYQFNNHLYGGQIGADWALTSHSNPLQLNIVGKAGIFGNADDGGIFEYQGAGRTFIGSFAGRGSSTAFVGEIDFTAAYILTDHIAVRGGYQLLWLSDLALATDAASRSLLNPSLLRTVHDDGNLFYQGATVGIDFTW